MKDQIEISPYNTIFERLINFDKESDEDCMTFIHRYQTMIDELEEEQIEEKAWLLNKIGYHYAIHQNFDISLRFFKESLVAYEKVFQYCDEEMPQTYELLANMSMVYYCLEMYDDALTFVKRALKADGYNNDAKKIACYDLMSTIILKLGHYNAVEDDQRVAATWSDVYYGKNHPITKRLKLRKAYAAIKGSSINNNELIVKFWRAFDSYISDYDKTSVGWALGCEYQSDILNVQGQFKKALKKANEARVIREKTFGLCYVETRIIYRLIADIYARNGELKKAICWLNKSMQSVFEIGASYSVTQEAMCNIYIQENEWDKAIGCLEKSFSHCRQIYKGDCNQSNKIKEKMAEVYLASGQQQLALDSYSYILEHCDIFDYCKISCLREKMGDIYLDINDRPNAYSNYYMAQEYYKRQALRIFQQEYSNPEIEKKMSQLMSQLREPVRSRGILIRLCLAILKIIRRYKEIIVKR